MKNHESLLQFIKFACVGASNVLVSLVTYYCLLYLGLHYQYANALAYLMGMINSFFFNSKWVFSVHDKTSQRLVKFIALSFILYVLSAVLMKVWIDIFNFSTYCAPLFNVVVITLISYLINKKWVFGKSNQ